MEMGSALSGFGLGSKEGCLSVIGWVAVSECMGLCSMHKWGASVGRQFEWPMSAVGRRGLTSVVLL